MFHQQRPLQAVDSDEAAADTETAAFDEAADKFDVKTIFIELTRYGNEE